MKNKEQETIEEKYPNVATFGNGQKKKLNDDNFFKDHDLEVIRQKYIKFTVFMEAINDVLELGRETSVEQFAMRVRDIVYAAQQEEDVS